MGLPIPRVVFRIPKLRIQHSGLPNFGISLQKIICQQRDIPSARTTFFTYQNFLKCSQTSKMSSWIYGGLHLIFCERDRLIYSSFNWHFWLHETFRVSQHHGTKRKIANYKIFNFLQNPNSIFCRIVRTRKLTYLRHQLKSSNMVFLQYCCSSNNLLSCTWLHQFQTIHSQRGTQDRLCNSLKQSQ